MEKTYLYTGKKRHFSVEALRAACTHMSLAYAYLEHEGFQKTKSDLHYDYIGDTYPSAVLLEEKIIFKPDDIPKIDKENLELIAKKITQIRPDDRLYKKCQFTFELSKPPYTAILTTIHEKKFFQKTYIEISLKIKKDSITSQEYEQAKAYFDKLSQPQTLVGEYSTLPLIVPTTTATPSINPWAVTIKKG
jgi:hypothetical protein